MKSATTPTHIFKTKFDPRLLKKLIISYGQNGNEILAKRETDCTFTEDAITLKLTQAETKLFTGGIPVDIELRGKDAAGDVIPSKRYTVGYERMMNDEEL